MTAPLSRDELVKQLSDLDKDYGILLQGTAKDAMRIAELEARCKQLERAVRNLQSPDCDCDPCVEGRALLAGSGT